MTTSLHLNNIARRTLIGACALMTLVLCVFAGPAHALPTNTGGGNGIPVNPPPIARFTATPNPVIVASRPLNVAMHVIPGGDIIRIGDSGLVTFNAATSTDDDGIAKYQWDLDGNGTFETTTTNAKVTHSYGQTGTFTIRLRVTDTGGKTSTTQHQVIVHRRPTAHLAASTPVALIGDTVNYTAAGSTDDNGISSYQWDLDGNGTFETNTGTSQTTSRSYGSIGDRTVHLRVTDVYGATSDTSVAVHIHRTPTAAFAFAPSPAFVGEQVTFDGSQSSDDESVAKYEWDLDGNGTFETDTAANPTVKHTYTQTGTVNVRLRVTDNRGATDIVTHAVAVQPRTTTPDTTAPRLRILTSRARMSRAGLVSIRVACPATERSCTGRLALRSLGAHATALGGKAFRLGGGQSATVKVKLATAKRRLVRRRGSVLSRASARVVDAAGNAGSASRVLRVTR